MIKMIPAIKKIGLLSYVQLTAIALASWIIWMEWNYNYLSLTETVSVMEQEKTDNEFNTNYEFNSNEFITVHVLQNYHDIGNRPLFSPSRTRPVIEEEPVIQAAVIKEPMDYSLKLNGVSINGKAKTALVWHSTERKFYTLERGDTVKNWNVKEIKPDSVVLNQNGTKMELLLRDNVDKSQ